MESPKDILLAKWLNKTISAEELEVLQQDYELEELDSVLRQLRGFDLDLKDSSVIWQHINSQLNAPDVTGQTKTKSSKTISWLRFIIIGAGLFLLGFLLSQWFGSKGKVITSPKAQTVNQVIADNTQFILSPGSSIDFDESTWSSARDIHLAGHVYFDVSTGPKFTVKTQAGSITVLGTQFEVWEKDGSMKVNCLEGRVEVMNLKGQSEIITKNESVYINDGILNAKSAHSLQKAEFLTSRYNYEKISIVSLAEELERYYNIDVTLDQIDTNINFSGILILDDVDKACSYIAETLNLKYERMSSGIKFFND